MFALMKPLVALDCDGILSHFTATTVDIIYEVTGKRFHWREVTQWNPWLQFGLSPEETQAVFEFIATPGVCESMEVLPGAQEGYDQLVKVADIVVVTSPWLSAPSWTFERMKWLSTHFGIGPEKLIHTSAKEYVSADFFVDDNANNVRRWNERNAGIGLLWTQPYNATIGDLPRLNGWEELVQLINDSKEGIAA